MGADSGDFALVQNDDPVRAEDGRHTLGHDQHRRALGLLRQSLPEQSVGLEVQRGEAVVKDVDVGMAYDRPGNGQTLPLTAGDVGAALGDGGFQLVGHPGHEVLALSHLQRVPHLLLCGVGFSVAQVGGHGAVEEQRVLGNHAQMLPELCLGQIPDVYAVEQDLALAGLVDPGNQVHQGGFAGSGGADNGGGLAGTGHKADVLQHRTVRLGVMEGDVPELQRGERTDISVVGAVVPDGGLIVENGVDPADGGHGPGDHVHHHGRSHDAHQDLHQIGDKRGQGTDLHAAGVDPDGAHVVSRQRGHIHDQADHRHQGHHQPLRAQTNAQHFHVCLVVAFRLIFRPDKGPDDPDARQLFPHDLV